MSKHSEGYLLTPQERFWVLAYPDLTVYGHSVDRWTRKHYPEDMEATRQMHLNGRDFGCWHSVVCPEGELGSNPVFMLRRITKDEYEAAEEGGWPFDSKLTTDQPSVSIHVVENGEWVEIYNSLEEGSKRGRS